LYFFLSTFIQYQSPGLLNEQIEDWALENNPIFKSFLLIRFLILIFVVDTLFFNKILNLKKFFLVILICTSFVSFDIIFQYFFGFDLFGFKSEDIWNSGPFGDEKIAGSYLQRFSFFSFFFIFYIFKNKNFNKTLLIFIIASHALAILLSGNKMPLILFLFGCGLIILLIKNLRLAMSAGLLVFILLFLVDPNERAAYVKNHPSNIHEYLSRIYKDFESHILLYKVKTKDPATLEMFEKKFKNKDPEDVIKTLRDPGYLGIFRTSVILWKEKPFLGSGLKSFRIKCWEILNKNELLKKPLNISCSNHAHNYYLELLSEAGIIGAGLMIIFFLILLKDSFYYLKQYIKKNNSEISLLMPIIIFIFLEIWPLKTTGSFFTTWNATFFWLNISILLAFSKDKSHWAST